MELATRSERANRGAIPEDWSVQEIGSLGAVVTGNTPSTRDPLNYGDDELFVSPFDLGATKYITRTEKMLSQKGLAFSRSVPANSILFVCIGSTIGKVGITTQLSAFNQQINAILPVPGVSPDYLYYAVSALAPAIKALAGEQAIPIVNKTQFCLTAVPLPSSKAEQEAIAEALSDADAYIESLEQLLAKKRDIRDGASSVLLDGTIRLPGHVDDWNRACLRDLVDVLPSGIYGTEHPQDGLTSFPVATTAHISDNDKWNNKTMRPRFFSPEQINGYAVNTGDLVVVKSSGSAASVKSGKIGLVTDKERKQFIFSNFLMVLRPTRVNAAFLYFQLTSRRVKRLLPSLVEASTYPNIRIDEYVALDIPLPREVEQRSIAAMLYDMDDEIRELELKRDKAAAVKQGMMQTLLTGRTRLV